MPRKDHPRPLVPELIEGALTELGLGGPKDVIAWTAKNYPERALNLDTLRSRMSLMALAGELKRERPGYYRLPRQDDRPEGQWEPEDGGPVVHRIVAEALAELRMAGGPRIVEWARRRYPERPITGDYLRKLLPILARRGRIKRVGEGVYRLPTREERLRAMEYQPDPQAAAPAALPPVSLAPAPEGGGLLLTISLGLPGQPPSYAVTIPLALVGQPLALPGLAVNGAAGGTNGSGPPSAEPEGPREPGADG